MEPQPRIGLAALTQFAFTGGELEPLRAELSSLYTQNPSNAGVLMDLSVLEQLEGRQDTGLQLQEKAFEITRAFRTLRPGTAKCKVLVIAAPVHMGGNTPVEFLLPSEEFNILTYFPDFDLAPDDMPALPEHDIAFCAAPADDENAVLFNENVRKLLRGTGRPVLNLPKTLVKPERGVMPTLFNSNKGLRFPKTRKMSRTSLERMLAQGREAEMLGDTGQYPFVVRPVGSHAGFGLAKVETPADFAEYLENRQEYDFFVSEFINYASDDGLFRKARIVCIDGQAFPCHLAVADQWDIWYLNSKMDQCADKRREEARFMDEFNASFAKRHKKAFETLTSGIGLDYYGFDCAEDREGNLVVFEVDNALIVHDMDCKATFPYKQGHMANIFRAFEKMAKDKAQDNAARAVAETSSSSVQKAVA